ncbi:MULTISPECIES: lytic polysaccharide monooxygenase [unclassified Streptomyces]|uniref:lytic polysaccharide monooxygenase auxiliary activity family 9 protein n=1 Tax=unclassified Streptomyces TaxID=2593676 RepID=UPI00344EF79C
MTARRKAAGIVTLGFAPFALTGLVATPAVAHGSLTDPVSRVSACFAEGPENPKSAACKAAVAAGGTQALYDWNGVLISNAAGKHRDLIPDGKLCSAADDKFKGLDLPRADWPATPISAGKHTFEYRATAPHGGSFELYITKPGYDPTKPLAWSDLEAKPFAKVTDPALVNGSYVFEGAIPQRSGKQLIYTVWQRSPSDSPEAFYACSDVVFGGGSAGTGGTGGGDEQGEKPEGEKPKPDADGEAPAPVHSAPSAPSENAITEGAEKSSIEHKGHGDDDANTVSKTDPAAPAAKPEADTEQGNAPQPNAAGREDVLAETGGSSSSTYLAVGGAAVLAAGAAVLFASQRRRAVRPTARNSG